MEKILGVWKADPANASGDKSLLEYIKPPHLTVEQMQVPHQVEYQKEGNVLVITLTFPGKDPVTMRHTMGATETHTSPAGMTMEISGRSEGGKAFIHCKRGDGVEFDVERYVEGDNLINEVKAQGKTLRMKLVR